MPTASGTGRAAHPARRAFARDATHDGADADAHGRSTGARRSGASISICCCSRRRRAPARRSCSRARPPACGASGNGRRFTVAAEHETRRHRHALRPRCAWLVGAGAIPQRGHAADTANGPLAFKAHFRRRPAAGLMPLLAFPGGYGGMVQQRWGRVTLSCCIRRDTLEQCREQKPMVKAGEAVLRTSWHRAAAYALRSRTPPTRAPGSRPGRSAGPAPALQDGIFRSAIPPARRIPSWPKASAWRCNRLGCCVVSSPQYPHPDSVARRYDAAWRTHCSAPRTASAAAFAQLAMRPLAVSAVLSLPGWLRNY